MYVHTFTLRRRCGEKASFSHHCHQKSRWLVSWFIYDERRPSGRNIFLDIFVLFPFLFFFFLLLSFVRFGFHFHFLETLVYCFCPFQKSKSLGSRETQPHGLGTAHAANEANVNGANPLLCMRNHLRCNLVRPVPSSKRICSTT